MAIRFFHRPPCGLCREIEGPLLRYAAQYGLRVTAINIDQDSAAFKLYWDKIPVIEIDGQLTLYEPIPLTELKAALKKASMKRD